MAARGISRVRIAEFAWTRMEPAPGRYDWGWLDDVVDILGAAGLGVVLGTPTAAPPNWLVERYPEILPVGADGQVKHFGSRRYYTFSSLAYRAECARIAEAMATRYGRHKAVVGWQIDNEYGCHDTTFSYSPVDLAAWRAWLRERYKTPARLNEAKMIHHFDHRWATYDEADSRDVTPAEKCDPSFEPNPRYWVLKREVANRLAAKSWTRGWLMGWRDISLTSVERTTIATCFPAYAINHKLPLFFVDQSISLKVAFLANLNSLVQDYCARQKLSGTSLTYFYLKQFPILPPSAYTEADLAFIVPRVLELTYTSHAMAPFARDLGYDGPPSTWDGDRRAQLRAELDAWYALAYGLSRDELRYVLDPKDVMGPDYPSETFRVLQNNEMKRFGEYRTRRLVLAAYDALAAAQPVTSGLADGTWERRIADELDVRLLLTALVRRMRGATPVADVLRAFVLAARPELLAGLLPDAQRAEWRRLLGSDANTSGNVVSIGASYLSRFREARAKLPPDALRFDAAAGTWDRGASIYGLSLPPWAEGRADFVWHALRLIDTNLAAAAMTEEERDFVTRIAA